jgi:pimeloyl-ACP methyl ester carboxylesterase
VQNASLVGRSKRSNWIALVAVPTIGLAMTVSCGTASAQTRAESRCDAFLGRTFEGATVTKATWVAESATAPEYCGLRAEMPRDLDFEINLPTRWNRRTIFAGGGGFDGFIAPAARVFPRTEASAGGYATITTNHGHNADVTPGASFALDVQMLAEYAYLAVPRVMGAATLILRERYGDSVQGAKIVYEGCSGGGRQGLIGAQRFPDMFDGVIARAPANAYSPQFLWYHNVAKQLAQPGGALTAGKAQAIGSAVMAKCDVIDGLRDGIIGRPDACTFDPAELACSGADSDDCLTPAQVASARAFYAPTNVANGRYVWPGFLPGGESPISWLMSTGAYVNPLMDGYIRFMVTQNPHTDPLKVDAALYTARIDQLVSLIDAVDADLSRFKARGGKLILWTGMSDWLITANNATEYYQSVVKQSGGQAAADEFVEYYTSPSVQHCAGGTGPDTVDLAGPMFDWLEKGIKPSTGTIIATQSRVDPGANPVSRPLCRYPQYPQYIDGDPNVAASFACTSP